MFSALDGSLSGCHGLSRDRALLLRRGAVVGRFRDCVREEQSPSVVAAAVANQESQAPEKQQRAGCCPRGTIRHAHLPDDAAVPPGVARLLSAWHRHRRLAAVGTIALRECDRRAGGAVGAGALLSLGDSSSTRSGRRRRSSPPWDQHRRRARTTASIRALARRRQAPDARLWRDGGALPSPGCVLLLSPRGLQRGCGVAGESAGQRRARLWGSRGAIGKVALAP